MKKALKIIFLICLTSQAAKADWLNINEYSEYSETNEVLSRTNDYNSFFKCFIRNDLIFKNGNIVVENGKVLRASKKIGMLMVNLPEYLKGEGKKELHWYTENNNGVVEATITENILIYYFDDIDNALLKAMKKDYKIRFKVYSPEYKTFYSVKTDLINFSKNYNVVMDNCGEDFHINEWIFDKNKKNKNFLYFTHRNNEYDTASFSCSLNDKYSFMGYFNNDKLPPNINTYKPKQLFFNSNEILMVDLYQKDGIYHYYASIGENELESLINKHSKNNILELKYNHNGENYLSKINIKYFEMYKLKNECKNR